MRTLSQLVACYLLVFHYPLPGIESHDDPVSQPTPQIPWGSKINHLLPYVFPGSASRMLLNFSRDPRASAAQNSLKNAERVPTFSYTSPNKMSLLGHNTLIAIGQTPGLLMGIFLEI